MTRQTLSVHNPATGALIGEYTLLDEAGIRNALDAARAAQPAWAALPLAVRRRHVAALRRWLLEHMDEAATIISDCTGKTRLEALATEVMPTIGGSRWYERQAAARLRPRRLAPGSLLYANKRTTLHRVPWGVIGIIAPWNYPLGIPMHEIVPALLAGNSVVFKTAPETLPVGEFMQRMFDAAGLPRGVFQSLIAEGPLSGEVFLSANGVDKLFFTGSVPVGRLLMEKAARHLIPVSLELGGKDAAIIRADADLDRAVAGVVWAGLSNAGQSCAGIERVYVHGSIYTEFVRRLGEAVERLRVGPGQSHDVDLGALTTERQTETVLRHIRQALDVGATLAARGKLPKDAGPRFVPPTVLINVRHDMAVMREETFGPVLGVMPFTDDEDAVALANDSPYGLTASVWTRDARRGRELALRLRAGMVTVNDHLLTHGFTEAPWGGFGQSGFSRGHGAFAFEEVTAVRGINEERFGFLKRNAFWHPYSSRSYERLKAALRLLYGGQWRPGNLGAVLGLVASMLRRES